MIVFSIGYEGITEKYFLHLLRKQEIEIIVDVRQWPVSRKRGFSKKALEQLLIENSIGYCHMPSLGCPKIVRDKLKNGGSWASYALDYSQHLQGHLDVVDDLAKMVSDKRCALLCYEADPNFCHRSIIARLLHENYGAQICHITSATTGTRSSVPLRFSFAAAGKSNQ